MQNLEWYHTLIKPVLNPPDWIFAPVWSVLYLMIFASFVIFVAKGNLEAKILPLTCFSAQMILNFIWSPVFFNYHDIKSAFIIICMMWLFILLTIIFFYKHSKISSILLIPYFLWVSFALYLNFELLILNSP